MHCVSDEPLHVKHDVWHDAQLHKFMDWKLEKLKEKKNDKEKEKKKKKETEQQQIEFG